MTWQPNNRQWWAITATVAAAIACLEWGFRWEDENIVVRWRALYTLCIGALAVWRLAK